MKRKSKTLELYYNNLRSRLILEQQLITSLTNVLDVLHRILNDDSISKDDSLVYITSINTLDILKARAEINAHAIETTLNAVNN